MRREGREPLPVNSPQDLGPGLQELASPVCSVDPTASRLGTFGCVGTEGRCPFYAALEGARRGWLGGCSAVQAACRLCPPAPCIPAGQQSGALRAEIWVSGCGGRHRRRPAGPRARPTFGERTLFPQAHPPLCQHLWGTADMALGPQGSQPPPGKGAQHSVGPGRGRASRRGLGLVVPASLPHASWGLS